MLLGLLLDIIRYIDNEMGKTHSTMFRNFFFSNISVVKNHGMSDEEASMEKRCLRVRVYNGLVLFIFVVGFFNLLCQWTPGLVKIADSFDTDMPKWIIYLYLLEFILYGSFGFVQVIFMMKRSCRQGTAKLLLEHNIHTILSFASKAVLVSFFASYLIRDNSDERGPPRGAGLVSLVNASLA